jgi:hypothetical protein
VPSRSRLDGLGTGATGTGAIVTSPFPCTTPDATPNPRSSVSDYGDADEFVTGGPNISVWANRVLPGSKKANADPPGFMELSEPFSPKIGHPVAKHVKPLLLSSMSSGAVGLLLTLGTERCMVGFDGPALSPVTMLIVHDPTVPLNDTQVPAAQGVPNTVMVEAPLVSISSSESARAVLGATRTSNPNAAIGSANFVVFMVPPEGPNVQERSCCGKEQRPCHLWRLERRDLAKPETASCQVICTPGFTIDTQTRILLESKVDMKDRGVDSPDDADAFALTFARNVARDSPRLLSRLGLGLPAIMTRNGWSECMAFG